MIRRKRLEEWLLSEFERVVKELKIDRRFLDGAPNISPSASEGKKN